VAARRGSLEGMYAYRGPARLIRGDRTQPVGVELWNRGDGWGGTIEAGEMHDLEVDERVRLELPDGTTGEALVSVVPAACVAYLVGMAPASPDP
jgi:hypothetical protein